MIKISVLLKEEGGKGYLVFLEENLGTEGIKKLLVSY